MSKSLYEFAPSANIIKGPHASDSTITIQRTNVAFSDEIPNDGDSKDGNKEGVDEGEDTDKYEKDLAADMGDEFTQKMNSPPRLNEHIRFSTTSSSSSADDTKHHGSTP
ncbi:unnamed protein product [Lactuca saligna]|uniref:Uncharacterized protein n=1 Tax=Lactuca saligna TaxID=75948 RepID=A0AA35ZC58_LACSI|nr:unnamed protein product [Lactuca saligna]